MTPVLVALCTACASTSVLVSPTDPLFARAQRRLMETTRYVEAQQPSDAERTLFLQAEGLYRYRFEYPPRSSLGYLAEGAAAVTDFPALQSLSASLDLADLRLSGPDGAIQLWETLLDRYPDSSLRTLALYRLGWAYRSTSIQGFPRHSGDEAFDILESDYPGSPLAGLAREARAVPWKSRGKAAIYSLIPGLGQMYEGRLLDGSIRLGIGVGGAAMVLAPIGVALDRGSDLSWHSDWPLLLIGTLGAIVVSIDYTAAYQDAMKGAVRFNEESEARFEDAHPNAP